MTFHLLEVKLLHFKCQDAFVIDAKMSFEQRANIKFSFKIGKTFTETFQLMKQVYGDDCLSRSRVHEWFQRFQSGREEINETQKIAPGEVKSEDNADLFL